MRNLIPVLMIAMSIPAIAFVPERSDCIDRMTGLQQTNWIIEDPDKIYEQYGNKIKDRIRACRNVLDTSMDSIKKRDMEETIKLLEEIIAGINELRRSSVVYTAVYINGMDSTRGFTVLEAGKVTSKLGRSSKIEEVVGHEIRHQVQYEWQEISLLTLQQSESPRKAGNEKYGVLHDITDETDAIKAGRLLKANAGENKRIRDRWTRRQRKEYRKLPQCPINIGSREGKVLRKTTAEAKAANRKPSDFYKGWEKDYLNP